jgi:signal transduction histidine kinase
MVEPLRHGMLQGEDLVAANRRKEEFLAELGHELRSPLGCIQSAIRVLRMTQLVDDLLDVSRISRGRMHLQRERTDLRDVVTNAIETVQSLIQERHHRLATELPDTPVWLQGDPRRLEQAFVNLLTNACRYTDPGGELAVWMHRRDGHAIIRIRDSGVGIAPEALTHIFDMFVQAEEAAPRSQLGLGIGLALVRKLVELHKGSVTAASGGLGRGSEFTVRLPSEE